MNIDIQHVYLILTHLENHRKIFKTLIRKNFSVETASSFEHLIKDLSIILAENHDSSTIG